jgi:pimeloyl-ACP methyl ester carboxylesterase
VRVHDRFVFVNGLRLHYREWGEATAPPVVLLHGGSAHAHWWDFFARAIADTYRVLALDLRGHGNSGRPEPAAYRIHDYAADLAAFIDAAIHERVDVVGHSLGGMVATAYAGGAGRPLNSLVVVDTPVRISRAGARYMARLRNFPHPRYRDRDHAIKRFRLLPTATQADPTILAHVATHGVVQLPDGRWTLKFDRESLAHAEPLDLTAVLRQLTCPILLVRGARSEILAREALAELLAAVPHAEGAEIAGAHHHVMLDNPTEFERVVRAFLDCNLSRGGAARP